MSLKHAELKAARAMQHLDDLKQEIADYYASEPVIITDYIITELGRRYVRFRLKDLSDKAYLLVGDFAHNLRCVLDHIIYSLVVKSTGKVPRSRNIQWPVQASIDNRAFAKQTDEIPTEAAILVESFQPYHSSMDYKEHPLWQLHMLDIVDKHRRVVINSIAMDAYIPTLSESCGIEKHIHDTYVELSVPVHICPFPLHYNPKPTIHFGASEEDLILSIERLGEIHNFVVATVLPKFAHFFVMPSAQGSATSALA